MRHRSFTQEQARRVLDRHGPTCYWCRAPLVTVVIDHYVPFVRGGRTTVENGVPSCVRCNQDKRDLMPDEYRAKIDARNECGRDLMTLVENAPPLDPVEKMPDLPRKKESPHRYAAREGEVRAALLQLDPDDDSLWNKEGGARWRAVSDRTGFRTFSAEVSGGWAPAFQDRHAATCRPEAGMDDYDDMRLRWNREAIREGGSVHIRLRGALPGFDRAMARLLRSGSS